jgi:6-phosphogluconolactonase
MHPVPTEGLSLEEAALRYGDDLCTCLGRGAGIPQFDLILLGVGDDGHTASLFPGSAGLAEKVRPTLPVITDHVPNKRITLTLPVINNAKNVVSFVTGRNKSQVMKKLLEDKADALPAALVSPANGKHIYVLDAEAASGLEKEAVSDRFVIEEDV